MWLTRFGSIARETTLPAVVFLLVAVVTSLPALAYSDPPDPTWESGIWDDDDFDNIVEAVTDTLVGVDPGPVIVLHVDLYASPCPLPADGSDRAPSPLDWFEGRAPPLA